MLREVSPREAVLYARESGESRIGAAFAGHTAVSGCASALAVE